MGKDSDLEYNLEAMGGEDITSYVDRLFDFYKEVSKNKLASYAQFVSKKRSVVTGEFNGVELKVDYKSDRNEIIKSVKNKLKIK